LCFTSVIAALRRLRQELSQASAGISQSWPHSEALSHQKRESVTNITGSYPFPWVYKQTKRKMEMSNYISSNKKIAILICGEEDWKVLEIHTETLWGDDI
jgi:hypothetical protein